MSNTGAISDFVLNPANVGERRARGHLLAVEADRTKLRPVLADNGYCGDRLANLFGRRGGRLWYALRRSQSPDSKEEMALRAWHRGKRARIESVFGSLDDQFQMEETRARSVWGASGKNSREAAGLHGRISNQPSPWAAANRAEKPIPVSTHVLNHSTTRSEKAEKAPQGDLYLFDCGYFSIDQYHRITETGNSFVTKLHGNIEPEPVCSRPVPEAAADSDRNAAGYSVLEDRLVRLGDDRTDREGGNPGRWYRVLTVEVSTEEQVQVLTNLLWIDAEQICRLYKHRWSIEIVFRWLKDRMQLDQFISRDPTGVVRQTLAALIVWGLLAIFNEGGEQFSPKRLWRKLQAAMHRALFDLGRRYQQNMDPPA